MIRPMLASLLTAALVLPTPASADPAQRIAWSNRLTWGASPAAPGPDAAELDRWLDAQLASNDTTLPPAAAQQIESMRITR